MYINKNYNPEGKLIGDCLVRALTAFHGGKKSYSSIKKELEAIASRWGVKYNNDIAIMIYCKNNNLKIYVSNDKRDAYMLRISKRRNLENIVIPTKNRRVNVNCFSRCNEGKAIVCSSNHAVYVENNDYIDTWDSGRRFVTYVIK